MTLKLIYLDIETTDKATNFIDQKPKKHNDYIIPKVEDFKIISVQWQEIAPDTGKELGPLNILKSWETNNELDFMKQIISDPIFSVDDSTFEYYDKKLQKTVESTGFPHSTPNFLFLPIATLLGYNLKFEQEILESKIEQWKEELSLFLVTSGTDKKWIESAKSQKITPKTTWYLKPKITSTWNIDLMNFALMRSGNTPDYNNNVEFYKKGGTPRGAKLQNISCKDSSGDVIQSMYEDKDWTGIENYIRKETKCAIETYRQLLDHMKNWNYKE